MSESTSNLELPFLAAEQAQKHVILNEALWALDCLVQLAVESRSITSPPQTPTEGVRYLLPENPQGAWQAKADTIAAFQDGAWRFHVPKPGWILWVVDEAQIFVRAAQSWKLLAQAEISSRFGIATSPDNENRLAVSSPASLFTHAGTNHRLKINKASQAATASVLLQDAYSGRAELGLAGDDDFHLKVSADGTNWQEALVVDAATGRASFPSGVNGLGGILSAEATVDFGLGGTRSASFDIEIADAMPGQRVMAAVRLPDGASADELEMDMICASASVTQAGHIRLVAASLSGPITGPRTFNIFLTQ